jgi:hypothetical protein
MMEAKIKLTKTMLDKSIIDANKSVQEFLSVNWQMEHDEWSEIKENGYDYLKPQGKIVFYKVVFEDSELETEIRFYKTKRGDKRISIKNIKKYADVGDTIIIKKDSEHGCIIERETVAA